MELGDIIIVKKLTNIIDEDSFTSANMYKEKEPTYKLLERYVSLALLRRFCRLFLIYLFKRLFIDVCHV